MKINQKGFGAIEALLILVAVGIIGGTGWYVWDSKKETDEALKKDNSELVLSKNRSDKKDEEKNYSTFEVKASAELNDKGSCESGEVLFAPIFNSESFDYPCQGLIQALDYAVIVFGVSDTSAEKKFEAKSIKNQGITTLANGVIAAKTTFQAQRKGHGTSTYYTANHTLYQVKSKSGKYFYGIYWTGEGFADENSELANFNDLVKKNWEIK